MIITKLAGGLGNQMFQYAIARNLARKNFHTKIFLDISFLENSVQSDIFTKRDYELAEFNIKAYTTNIDSLETKLTFTDKLLKRDYIYIREKGLEFEDGVLRLRGNIFLEGHWASERYFSDIKNLLIKDFNLRTNGSEKYLEYLSRINKSRTVAIHVRRGDYITNKLANKFHGTCDIAYYQRSIDLIRERAKPDYLFVFSDDMGWCKKQFIGKEFVFVEGTNAHEDMMLMKNCAHNIIANSTFSWWGAWLNENTNKIVIAPKSWFKDAKVEIKDLLPEGWIKL